MYGDAVSAVSGYMEWMNSAVDLDGGAYEGGAY